MIEALIVLLITAIGHFIYYKNYDLNIFPSKDYLTFFLGVPFLGLIIVSLFKVIFRSRKREEWLSVRGFVTLFLILVVFFNWIIPLAHKYYYVQRLDMMEDIFLANDTSKIIEDGDIMIAFVESSYDPLMRPRYRSRTYNNYFYIKNNGDEPYKGNIYLTLYNEENDSFDLKLIKDAHVASHATELLIEKETPLTTDEWTERTFGTKQQVNAFEAVIAQ